MKADKNKDEKLSQSEMKNFLRLINIEVDDEYAEMIFKVKSSELFDGSWWSQSQKALNAHFKHSHLNWNNPICLKVASSPQ